MIPVDVNAVEVDGTSITANVSSVDFGVINKGFSKEEADGVLQVVRITNNGTTTVTIRNTNPTSSGPFGCYWFDSEQEIVPGEYIDIELRLLDNSAFTNMIDTYSGTYVFTATNVLDSTDTMVLNINAKVSVVNLKGDMNHNGKIDLKDIILLIKTYLGIDDISDEDSVMGDMNHNGKIDLKDIILLIKFYLNPSSQRTSCYNVGAKSERTVIKTITTDNIERTIDIINPSCNDGACTSVQSMTVVKNMVVIGKIKSGNVDSSILVYNLNNGELMKENHIGSNILYHVNGMTTGPDDRVYLVSMKNGNVFAFDVLEDGSIKFVLKNGSYDVNVLGTTFSSSGIAYDEFSSMFYFSSGKNLRKYHPVNQSLVTSIERLYDYTAQDIGAYRGIILSIETTNGGDGSYPTYLNLYRVDDLAYIGSYYYDFKSETESVGFWNGKLVIVSNGLASDGYVDKIYILQNGVIDFNKDCY